MHKPLFLILLLTVLTSPALSQTLSGKVTDLSTGSPLHYAHIACPETGEGTITDEGGNFTLIVKDITKARTLIASFVGYQTMMKTVKDAQLVFALSPDTTTLKSIEITSPDPDALIRLALRKIPDNHGGQRLLTCFYRMVTKNQDKYIQVSEASFELNQFPLHYNQVKVLKAREAEDDKAFNGVGMGIGTPVASARSTDITMRADDSFLGEKNRKKYNFFYEGILQRGDVEVHEISFDQKNIKDALYKGRLYLHTGSLAFVAVEYELSPKGIAYLKFGNAAQRAAMKLLDIDINILVQRLTLTYRRFGDKWYLDHVVRDEHVRVKSKRYNFDVPVAERGEFLVTRIDTTFRRAFAEEELTKSGFIESAADTSKSFWQDYNTIPSQIDYNAIAREIESRNGYASVKTALRNRMKNFPKDPAIRADCVLTYYHSRGLFNGTALVKHKGKVILHKGYGYADRELKIMNDTSTVFRIGSIAKTFTSRIIWQLEQEGLLKYSDSVQRFVPWYPHNGITIHHLLTHSSGIPNFMAQAAFIDSIRHPFTIEELIRNFGLEKPTFAPGSEFKYSNTGYTLLALIAEKASGKTFAELFTEKITVPLRLNNTSFARQHPAQAKGYWNGVPEPAYAIGNTAGAGAVSATAADLLKWDEAHNDPRLAVLFVPRTWYHDWGSHYGYGWNIDKYQFWASKKHTIHYHGGTDFGFKSMLARQPDQNNLVVLLNNTGEFPLFDITDLVLNILN
ncbi:serine hydrolase [Fulvivirgaceae bacterium PWU4]|uniref:Serine hydrolase n=1 Tax=Chryseosolibacter histidini TaxID=2782349 RepID=A0AAP2DFY2_9BACT|nr:serine hydrolase [Chryseosolibacter histidini]MBT1695686.1 serine hydrolase [Chryseosolibacter histidini]